MTIELAADQINLSDPAFGDCPSMTCPCAFARAGSGPRSRRETTSAGHYFAKHLPNARLHVFPETGHWLQIERGQEFAAAVRSFLAQR